MIGFSVFYYFSHAFFAFKIVFFFCMPFTTFKAVPLALLYLPFATKSQYFVLKHFIMPEADGSAY